jgi:thioesterase domain-containing protein
MPASGRWSLDQRLPTDVAPRLANIACPIEDPAAESSSVSASGVKYRSQFRYSLVDRARGRALVDALQGSELARSDPKRGWSPWRAGHAASTSSADHTSVVSTPNVSTIARASSSVRPSA